MSFTYLLRRDKGSPLTNDQVDDNFEHLRSLIEDGTITNSADLAALLNDETGTGRVVYNTSPVFTTSILTNSTTFGLLTTVVTTLNFATLATTINIGATAGVVNFAGAIQAIGDIVAFSSSDISLKTNIKNIPNALAKVKYINGVTWSWKEDVDPVIKNTPTTGLIAQEVEAVLPEVVIDREDGTKAIDYSRIIGLLVEAIKELNEKVEELSAANKSI